MPAQRRHRSTVACVPCSNCTQDRTTCAIQEIGHELLRSTFPISAREASPVTVLEDAPGTEYSATLRNKNLITSPDYAPQTHKIDATGPLTFNKAAALHDNADTQLDPERQRDLDEEQSGAELSYAARGQGNSSLGTPFYTGEQPGVTSLFDTQEPIPRHIMLRPAPPSVLSRDDRDFLQRKGALKPLLLYSHREFLRAYFHHVHPMLPILHLARLQEFEFPESIPLHADMHGQVRSERRVEGREFHIKEKYERYDCMYDNSGETDKEVLLQAALLLSFWHSDRDSHSQPWYWSGVAISWCHIIGMHRDPDAARVNPLVSPQRRNLWRRLWASCLFRDRWLSLTLGRPLRIRLSDCDMPFPVPQDVLHDLSMLPNALRAFYIPEDLSIMIEHWVLLIRLSRMLGEVLSLFYQQLGVRPTLLQFDALESQLSGFALPEPFKTSPCPLAMFSYYHLQLHYQATLITFYRPFVSTVPQGLPPQAEEAWKSRVRTRMDTAATNSNGIVDCIARDGLVGFATPMTPPLLIPAMHVHLLNCKSENHLTRRLALNKLEMCMAIMRELQKTHTSASIFCGVFGEAIRQLAPGPLDESIWGVPRIRRPQTVAALSPEGIQAPGVDDFALQTVVTDDILESLLNETSSYNFWESINMPEQSWNNYREL
ncbi:DNA binding [Ascochyta rabiei]|uniref:DNA binding n=1 Tax=Didymella rabiei TaxID=5454 RepID=A0A163KWN9_DIDRA|nr:DNA binding [Ascochyta rabiei]